MLSEPMSECYLSECYLNVSVCPCLNVSVCMMSAQPMYLNVI